MVGNFAKYTAQLFPVGGPTEGARHIMWTISTTRISFMQTKSKERDDGRLYNGPFGLTTPWGSNEVPAGEVLALLL